MPCQARIIDKEYPLKDTSPPFYTTKECAGPATKRICNESGDRFNACDSCFRRYNTGEWYGWFDCSYPKDARVVGSPAFFLHPGCTTIHPSPPKQKKPDAIGCKTCWRTSVDEIACKTCSTGICNVCAVVPPLGYSGSFCKKCVPRKAFTLAPPVPTPTALVAVPAVEVVPARVVDEIASITATMSSLTIHEPSASASASALATISSPTVHVRQIKKKETVQLTYPILTDIASLSLENLQALHKDLLQWMKEYSTKFPRQMVPYYKYRMVIESHIINKK